MSSVDALILLGLSFPIVIWAAWSDLKFMTIPNKACIALFVLFVIVAPFLLPLPDYGVRLLQAVIVLIIGFVLTSIGILGGGDSKLFAAMAPFVAYSDIGMFFFLLAFLSLAAIVLHRLLPRLSFFKSWVSGWKSFNVSEKFPFGLPLAGALSMYLAVTAYNLSTI